MHPIPYHLYLTTSLHFYCSMKYFSSSPFHFSWKKHVLFSPLLSFLKWSHLIFPVFYFFNKRLPLVSPHTITTGATTKWKKYTQRDLSAFLFMSHSLTVIKWAEPSGKIFFLSLSPFLTKVALAQHGYYKWQEKWVPSLFLLFQLSPSFFFPPFFSQLMSEGIINIIIIIVILSSGVIITTKTFVFITLWDFYGEMEGGL